MRSMKITGYRTLTKSSQVYITQQMRKYFNFPISRLFDVKSVDESKYGKPVIIIRKGKKEEGKNGDKEIHIFGFNLSISAHEKLTYPSNRVLLLLKPQ